MRGCVNLESPCEQTHLKGMLGKHSSCKPSNFGEMVSLCRFVHIDGNLTTVVGSQVNEANPMCKSHAGDPEFIVKILLDSTDKKDFKSKEVESEQKAR